MTYNLFLDDERFPPRDDKFWVISRTYEEAISTMCALGCPQFMSFDHDLGDAQNGLNVAHWMVNCDLDSDGQWMKNFEYTVHSMNPIGSKNIQSFLSSYLNSKV